MNITRSIIRSGVLRHAIKNRTFRMRTYTTTVDTGESVGKYMEKMKCIHFASQFSKGPLEHVLIRLKIV